jgi:precorrin-2 dehydrogenase/sirohydrochlorin ferrochelatase
LPDLDARRAFLREALTGPAAEAAMADDMAGARQLLEAALEAWDAGAIREGRLWIVEDGAADDLLSLRAARALAQADVLIVDDGAAPAILALARREARRLAPAAADPAELSAIAAQGLQIVWVGGQAIDPGLLEALAARGVRIERLRAAPA